MNRRTGEKYVDEARGWKIGMNLEVNDGSPNYIDLEVRDPTHIASPKLNERDEQE
uniref:Uncharacterized protein n=1 Tax=Arundo donax TaxID=35708 RepID=A0A0A9C5P7_ARUDO